MRWMPYRLIHRLAMLKAAHRHLLTRLPQLDSPIHARAQKLSFVDMIPLTALHLGGVCFVCAHWVGRPHLPEIQGAISASREDLLLVAFVETDVETGVWGKKLLHKLATFH